MTTYREEKGDYLVILNGVTEDNKKKLASSILETIGAGSFETPEEFINPDYVDADKYSYTQKGFDSYHCWLASTSNILRISGWAEDFQNPLISVRNPSYEDDLLAFFTSSLTDAGSLSEWALSYYFDGMLGKTISSGGAELTSEPTSLKPYKGDSWKGFQTAICSQALTKSVSLTDHLSYLENLEKLESTAIETTIVKVDPTTKAVLSDSAHSLTIVGVVIDQTKTGTERVKALLIADSDNESCVDSLPESFEEANQVKREKANSYTLYQAGTLDGKFGFFCYGAQGYFAMMTELTCLPFREKTDFSAIQETASYATCNPLKSGDLAIARTSIFGDDYESHETYQRGDKINFSFAFINRNDRCPMNQDNTGKEILQNIIEVYRNGEKVGTITDANGLSRNLQDSAIKPKEIVYGNVVLTDSGLFASSGDYRVLLRLNTNECQEAYTLNNQIELNFTIL